MKNKGWRPTVITDTLLDKLEEWFSMWMTDVEACLYVNINPSTLYDYIKKNPEFSKRKEDLKHDLKMVAKTIMNKSLRSWDKSDAKWYLERKGKDEFSLRQEVDQKTEITIDLKELEEASDEDLEKLINW